MRTMRSGVVSPQAPQAPTTSEAASARANHRPAEIEWSKIRAGQFASISTAMDGTTLAMGGHGAVGAGRRDAAFPRFRFSFRFRFRFSFRFRMESAAERPDAVS